MAEKSRAGVVVQKRRKTLPKDSKPTPDEIMVSLAALNERDKEILTWLFAHRYASTDQLYRRFWARDGADAKKLLQDCRRRMWELGATGLVAAVAYQQRSRAWCLDRKGLQAAQTLLRVPAEDWIPPDEWSLGSSSFLEHYITTTEIACQLEPQMIEYVERRPEIGHVGALYRWESRRRVLWSVSEDRKTSPRFQYDDGRLLFRHGHEDDKGRVILVPIWSTHILEVDLNTEPMWVIEEKLDRYQAAFTLADSVPEGSYPDLAPWTNRYILFACNDARRAQAIQVLIDERILPGLAVPLNEAVSASHRMERTVSARMAEAEERRRQAEEKQRLEEEERQRQKEAEKQRREAERRAAGLHLSKHDQYMAWHKYDQEMSLYRCREDEYVKQHKFPLFKSEAQCRAEFQAAHPMPKPPTYARPDHWH